ncbi:MAG: hypothetical protein PHI35_06790 [Victivallaceae bacterium]|nr:hypothetical protein [Victivallaceae bacterium]
MKLLPVVFMLVWAAAGLQGAGEPAEAVEFERRLAAARSGDAESALYVGNAFMRGDVRGPQNAPLAAYWFGRAAAAGNHEAQYNLGLCHEFGWGAVKSNEKATECYRLAAAAGLLPARLRLARFGLAGEAVDRAAALNELRELAGQDYAPAQFELASHILSVEGRKGEHFAEVVELARKAARAADPLPEHLLFLADVTGDLNQAAALLEQAAAMRFPDAQARLAEVYEFGLGRPVDRHRAFSLNSLAADAGSARGLTRMGQYWLEGDMVGHDPARAAACFTAAAEMGYAPARLKLGKLYEDGVGVERLPVRAVGLYTEAAKSGNRAAALELARCYRDGVGVEKDPAGAEFWSKRAAESRNDLIIPRSGGIL